jgi:hypothetical protein
MKIGTFADLCIAKLGYNSIDKKVDRREIIAYADAVRCELYGAMLKGEYAELPDHLLKSVVEDVKYDTSRARYYANKPEHIDLDAANGIRRVGDILDDSQYFIEVANGSTAMYGELESTGLAGKKGFWEEGNKIYFTNMLPSEYEKVRITYAPSLLSLKLRDEMPMSADYAKTLIDTVVQSFFIQKQTPQDKANDNVSN